jgi:hypothetical protein
MSWVVKNPQVIDTYLEEGAVLLNFETKYYYSLNDFGMAIWKRIESVRSLEELIEDLMTEYEGEKEQIRTCVADFLRGLEGEQLVLSHSGEGDEGVHQGSAKTIYSPSQKKPFVEPDLVKHDEPLHEVVMNPFDPQLPLAE